MMAGTCAHCGEPIPAKRLAKNARQVYCSRACMSADPAWRLHMTTFNTERWARWRAAGVDPTHTKRANRRRGRALRGVMRERWEEWRARGGPPPTHTTEANEKRRESVRARAGLGDGATRRTPRRSWLADQPHHGAGASSCRQTG